MMHEGNVYAAGSSEHGFLQKLTDKGFHVAYVPQSQFHEEYQQTIECSYYIVQAMKLF